MGENIGKRREKKKYIYTTEEAGSMRKQGFRGCSFLGGWRRSIPFPESGKRRGHYNVMSKCQGSEPDGLGLH